MPLKSKNILFRLDIPDIDRFIIGCKNNPFPVGTKGKGVYEYISFSFSQGIDFTSFNIKRICIGISEYVNKDFPIG